MFNTSLENLINVLWGLQNNFWGITKWVQKSLGFIFFLHYLGLCFCSGCQGSGEEKITLNTSPLSFYNYLCRNIFYKQFEEISRIGIPLTAQKTKFCMKDFSSKCDQIRRKLRIWSHLLKKFLMENFILCAVTDLSTSKSFDIFLAKNYLKILIVL